MDYFWLYAAAWGGFGALLASIVLRRFDISRMSYREARQLLSAMVASLSSRIGQNEKLTKALSEDVQILTASQVRLREDMRLEDRERLLGYMQDWISNSKAFVEKVDDLQKKLKDAEVQLQQLRRHVDRLSIAERGTQDGTPIAVGVVTRQTLTRLSSTEKQVLELLMGGPKAGPEISRLMTKSREHTARLMKLLFEQGFVERETNRQPYEYRLNNRVRTAMGEEMPEASTQAEG